MGSLAGLVSWDLDSRQQLQDACIITYGQRRRSFLVCIAGAQDVCAITLFKSPWPIYPSLSVLSSSHGEEVVYKSGVHYHQFGKEHPQMPMRQRNPRSRDFKHKVTRKALWVDGWSTPSWVKAKLKLLRQGKLESHVGYCSKDSEDIAQPNSTWMWA